MFLDSIASARRDKERRFFHLYANIESNKYEDCRKEKRHPPSPRQKRFVAHDHRKQRKNSGSQQVAQRTAGRRQRWPKTAILGWARRRTYQYGAAPRTTY